MAELRRYLQARGIDGEGRTELPLIAALAITDPAGGQRLARASSHWLRHSCGTHALEKGVPLEVVQSNLGHASLTTTTHYVTAEEQRRYREIERISQTEGEQGRGDGQRPSSSNRARTGPVTYQHNLWITL